MADKEFNSLEEFANYINPIARKVLKNNIGNMVEGKIQQYVKKDVYDVYPNPKRYIRSYERGESGLISQENIVTIETSDGIEIDNITQHGGKYITDVVETGKGYDYTGYGYAYEKPRPFMENTEKELISTNIIDITFKQGMKENNIDIE